MYARNGLTLLEVLVVLLIVAALVALLIPVSLSIRKRTNQAHCVENMRQIHKAWALYLHDYGGSETNVTSYPDGIYLLMPYIKEPKIVMCPSDPTEGYRSYIINTSYGLLSGVIAEDVLAADSNPGIVTCSLHGQCRYRDKLYCKGLVLRIRLDGSLGRGKFLLICLPDGGHGWEPWYYYTDAHIPQKYLIFGGTPCDPEEW